MIETVSVEHDPKATNAEPRRGLMQTIPANLLMQLGVLVVFLAVVLWKIT